MLQKNYTNPLDKGRFGFSASGKFNAPYKLETLLISLAIAGGIVVAVLIVLFAAQFVQSNPTGGEEGRMFEALVGGAIMLGAVVVFIVSGLIIKIIAQGYRCSYIADEEKFVLDYGGTHHTIYYAEVQNVHFLPRSFFGKVHGYTVTVKVSGADEEFAVTSDGYISENATPFYIIKERTEMLRHEEEARREASQAVSKTYGISDPVAPLKREDVSLTDRVASLLGKDAEMPGISPVNSPRSDTVLPDIAAKVSPTVNGYADDMPAVGANGKVIKQAQTYIGSDGRERSVNDIIAAGSFREVMKPVKAVLIGAAALAVYVVVFTIVYVYGINAGEATAAMINWDPSLLVSAMSILLIIAFPFYAVTIINYLKKGDIYNYKANGREFVVTSKTKKEDRIVYADVQDVVYNKMEFLWFIKGYRVEILTRYGVIKYNYVCEGINLPATSALPFEVIRERIVKG